MKDRQDWNEESDSRYSGNSQKPKSKGKWDNRKRDRKRGNRNQYNEFFGEFV